MKITGLVMVCMALAGCCSPKGTNGQPVSQNAQPQQREIQRYTYQEEMVAYDGGTIFLTLVPDQTTP